MKIIVNNLRSKIETDNPNLLKALIEKYSFTRPDARWTRGDGKKKFIHKNGYFRTGLLNRLLEDLRKIDCYPVVENKTLTKIPVNISTQIGGYTLYDFQIEIISKAFIPGRNIIKSPTGSGKTLIMAAILKAIDFPKTLILFTQKQLVNQTFDFFKKCGIECGYCTGEGYIPGNIMLCTVQSLERVIQEFIDCKVFMVDEAHEFSQSSDREAVINAFPNTEYRFGFTATPPSDKIGAYRLEGAFGPVLEVVSASQLVNEGKLTKPLIKLLKMPTESTMFNSLNYFDLYERFIINNNHRNNLIAFIAEDIRTNNEKAKTVILVKNLNHLEILQEMIPEAVTLQGSDNIKERYEKINKFVKDGGIIIGTKILQTGINIEEITHLINARGLAKDIPTLQAMGRALRKHESKSKVFIYDFMDTVKYLSTHSSKRNRHYEKEGHEVEEI